MKCFNKARNKLKCHDLLGLEDEKVVARLASFTDYTYVHTYVHRYNIAHIIIRCTCIHTYMQCILVYLHNSYYVIHLYNTLHGQNWDKKLLYS